MSHSTSTTNYKLSQFAGTDKPAWLEDYNADMLAIDTNLKSVSNTASAASTAIPSIQADLDNVEVTANSAESKASGALANLADTYDATASYAVGNIVLYQNISYECIVAITIPEPFNGDHWKRITFEELLDRVNGTIANLHENVFDVAEGSITGEMSDVTIYNNRLHKNVKVVHLYALMNIPNIDYNDAWIATIPNEYKPSQDRYITGTASDGTTKAFTISSSGHLRNAESIPNKTYYFDSIWIL